MPLLERLIQDIRYAFRSLLKAPGFTIVAVAVLAIGVGANTAMFSLVDAMLLRGLPYPESERLVVLIGTVQRTTVERRGNSLPDYLDWRAKSTTFVDMAAYDFATVTLSGVDEPERLQAEVVSAQYFDILGVSPAYGRTFRAEEDAVPNRDFVAILSDSVWRRRFGGDPAIVNTTIQLNGRAHTVVGIMPPGETGITDTAQIWLPFALSGWRDNRGSRGFQAIARLKPGVAIDRARAELDVISAQLAAAYPATNDKRAVTVSPLSVETFGQLQPIVLTLMAAVCFVLLIACANVANLLIGRADARQKEIAVRTALGAGRKRLAQQLITESCVLTMTGALAGMGLAYVAVKSLVAASPVQFPTFMRPSLSVAVLLFTIGMAFVTGIALGLAPALHARRGRLSDALKESSRGGSEGRRSQRLRSGLIVAEVALAVVLFIGAGLMIRSTQRLAAVDPGFDPSGLLTVSVSVPRQAPPAGQPQAAPGQPPPPPPPFVLPGRELIERVRSVPGVTSVSLVSDVPLTGAGSAVFYSAEGDTTTDAQTVPRAFVHRVSPAFFETLRLPLRGRTFDEREATPTSTVVIVSEALITRFWPNQDPIGKRIRIGAPSATTPAPWLTIVGVVPETKYRALPANPTADPDIFLPALDRSPQPIIIRSSLPPTTVLPAVRAAIRQGQPAVAVFATRTIDELIAQQTSATRFTTWVLGLFAGTALILSVIGIYGVMSYLVAQRTREFGIRLALGASRRQIVGAVLWHGITLIAIGALSGIVLIVPLSRLFQSLLFEVTALDASSAYAIALLVAAALVACVVPAVRATRVDPAIALRAQ